MAQPGPSAHTRIALLVLLCVATLSGCASRDRGVPVSSAGEAAEAGARYHSVRKGETLYSIAWSYGLDYRELAAHNSISAPFTIYIDQKLSLPSPSATQVRDGGPETLATPGATPAPRPPPPAPKVVPKTSAPAAPASRPRTSGAIDWQWPLSGKVIREFDGGEGRSNGIDIRGSAGQSVTSAADGVVVYAGGGLRGYGKLIIVKHSDTYLSAYGHNRALLVKEGQTVKGGQVVAEVGTNGAEGEMLHFEIRRNGKPENPLVYLPRR